MTDKSHQRSSGQCRAKATHGGDQEEGQSRVVQVTLGSDQGWELYVYQPLKGRT